MIIQEAVEVKSPKLETVAETSSGLSDKTPGPEMPCQVVYLCACDKENDPCKVVGEFYESTLTIFTATAGGGPCVVEE